ncbi:hypothetical protein pb186bvf_004602 [Paramecium bursaria]
MENLGDFICGAFSGICFFVSGQPFDQNANESIKDYIFSNRQGYISNGRSQSQYKLSQVKAFYKGMLSPILVGTPANAALFLAYESMMRILTKDPYYYNHRNFLLKEWIIAGGFAGIVYALFICPTEMIKIVLQMQFEYLPKQYKSPLNCIKSFYNNEGARGLFKGMVATQCRDIPQNAAFFSTFEVCKYYLLQMSDQQELGLIESFLAGALSGLACSSASYPFDNIKTRIQCEVQYPKEQRQYCSQYYDGGVMNCSRQIYRTQGLKGNRQLILGFFIGYVGCTLYQVIGSSAQFASYEKSRFYYDSYILKY